MPLFPAAGSSYVPEDPEHVPTPSVVYISYQGNRYCRAVRAGTLFSETRAHPTPVFYLIVPAFGGTPPEVPGVFVTVTLKGGSAVGKSLLCPTRFSPGSLVHVAWLDDDFRRIALTLIVSEMNRLIGWVQSEARRGKKLLAKLQVLKDSDPVDGMRVNDEPPVYERIHPSKPEETLDDGTLIIHTQKCIVKEDAPDGVVPRAHYGGELDEWAVKQGWEQFFPGKAWYDSTRTKPGWMSVEVSSAKYKPEYDLLRLSAVRLRDILGESGLPVWPV